MKYETVIDKQADPRVVIYARERTPEVERIEKFVGGESGDIIGDALRQAPDCKRRAQRR